jgi:hypothetical protein
MNAKKFLLTAGAVFVVGSLLGFLFHGTLLQPDYRSIPQLNRPHEEQAARLPFLFLGNICFAVAFAGIFAKGVEAKPWLGQGARFGLLAWLLASVPTYLTYYITQPWPGSLVVKQLGVDLAAMVVLGVVAAAIYRK